MTLFNANSIHTHLELGTLESGEGQKHIDQRYLDWIQCSVSCSTFEGQLHTSEVLASEYTAL